MKISTTLFSKLVTCATLLLALGSCSGGGGSGGGSTTAPPPATGSATVTGTVSGTVIMVLRAETQAVISQFDTAPLTGTGTPPFQLPFTLSKIPVGVPIKIFFFSAGETFPLYVGNSSTNVFTVKTAGPIDLGFVTMGGGTATPQHQPSNVTLAAVDLRPLPTGIEPPPATLTVRTPDPATGLVIVDFAVQNFVIGEQGQQHLHISVDGGAIRHFFNGQCNGKSNKVVDDSGQLTNDVQWHSATSFQLKGLSVGTHLVSVKLATASENEFVNQDANLPAVTVTIDPPPPVPPPTLTIATPLQGASLPSGPVDVSFTVQDFTIGGLGESHLHIYLDGGTTHYSFLNDLTNLVIDGTGQRVPNIVWQSPTSFQITDLPSGPHKIRLVLANASHGDLGNPEANPPILNFCIQVPPGNPTLTINSPAQGAPLSPGPVLVTFTIQNSPVTTSTQPRMHFYVDNDPAIYKFYDGPGITETGDTSGVRYPDPNTQQYGHTHAVHWKSGSSIQLNALASGSHQVRFVLVDQSDIELPTTEKILNFTITAETSGDFTLLPVASGLNFPVSMATAPDGRIFVTEFIAGNIRVVTPTDTLPWTLQPAPFYTFTSTQDDFVTGVEKGLLGIAVDPDFTNNHFVYAYYTTASGPKNRVVRLNATTDSNGNTVATSDPPTVILDNIPAGNPHNGGILQFGPDGMLYIFVGDNEVKDSQSLSTLRGKMLRINPNGGIPSDNPFINPPNNLLYPFSAIYSYGHRNSFGHTFHPHTNDLWETENGDTTDDQINRIIAGGNYGYPICLGICSPPDPLCPLCINPIITFTPVIAPTGIVAIREDSAYPARYHNNLLFADYNVGQLHRIVLGGAELTALSSHTIAYPGGNGALIAVMHGLNVLGQNGYIYVTNGNYGESNHRIFRVILNPSP